MKFTNTKNVRATFLGEGSASCGQFQVGAWRSDSCRSCGPSASVSASRISHALGSKPEGDLRCSSCGEAVDWVLRTDIYASVIPKYPSPKEP